MGMPKIAVTGAGVTGIATLKNLRKEEFDAVCFDERESLKGVRKPT